MCVEGMIQKFFCLFGVEFDDLGRSEITVKYRVYKNTETLICMAALI